MLFQRSRHRKAAAKATPVFALEAPDMDDHERGARLCALAQRARDELLPWLSTPCVPARPGFYLMETPTGDASETITGLGATGVDVMLAHVGARPLQCHPMIPLVQVASGSAWDDMDLLLDPGTAGPSDMQETLLRHVLSVASGEVTPRLTGRGYSHFQVTRGLLGVSL